MNTLTSLMAESALRAAGLGGAAGMLLAVWMLPPVFLRDAAVSAEMPASNLVRSLTAVVPLAETSPAADSQAAIYLTGVAIALLRLAAGLAWSWRLRASSERVHVPGPVEVRESPAVEVPLTFGWLRPFVLLPASSWRSWEPRKLEAVLLHEGAHVARGEFFVQTLAALHRAVYWFSPLAWWLKGKLAVLAQQASDDRVLIDLQDRAFYAEVLCSFLGKPRLSMPVAVSMASSASAAAGRMDRILEEGRRLSRGAGALPLMGISLVTGVMLYAASAISFAQAPPAPPAPPRGTATHTLHQRSNSDSESIEMRPGRLDYERNGKRYRITDSATLAEAKRLYAQVEQLGDQQAKVGERQAKTGAETGDLDAKIAAEMDAIRAATRKKALTGEEMDEVQARLEKLAAEVQARRAQTRGNLGAEQAKFGKQQAELGKKQAEASAKADRDLRKLIEQAIKDGRAKPIE